MSRLISNCKTNKETSLFSKCFSGKLLNKYIICFIFVYAICCVGGTYAYFALSASNNSIVGIAADIDLDLKVERIIPTSGSNAMVPQLENALGTAISSEYNCIDDNDNVVCQVYKATVTNTSTANVSLNGTISFSGITNLPNLKWKRIENATTIGNYSSYNASTNDVAFDIDKSLAINASEDYYFVVWIDEIGTVQTDNGTFRVTVKFNSADGDGVTSTIISTPFIEEVMKLNAISDENIDFSITSSSSGTDGIYLRSSTKDDTYPIYYYRGNVDNNMIFANTCWKVVRTTETGGLKLIYNGVPSNGQCNNTGESSQIGTKAFNTNYNSPAYVGYMYSNPYELDYKDMSSVTDTYVYGNDVTYSNGTYTLTNTISSSDWNTLYNEGLKNNHYTCFSTNTTCENVYYIYQTNSSSAYYMILTDGKNVEQALSEMLDNNTISSTIKGDKDTSGTVDNWYYTNIVQEGYSNYIEDTVWCNDRNISSLGGFNPDGGLTNQEGENDGLGAVTFFTEAGNIFDYMLGTTTTLTPNLSCSRNIDKFTVSETNGNGDLEYPVGLLTYSEILLAGGSLDTNDTYYLYTGKDWWGGSPFGVYSDNASVSYV